MKQNPVNNKLSSILSAVMGLVYLGAGVYLLVSQETFNGLLPQEGTIRIMTAVLLVAYGAFRLYRAKDVLV